MLTEWYPGSPLEMDEAQGSRKTTKFGSVKYVFPREEMIALRTSVDRSIARWLPRARILYWT